MSNAIFARNGNIFKPMAKAPSGALDKLEGGVYTPIITEKGELLVELISDGYSIPEKLYGDIRKNANIIFNSYVERANKPTGVMLHGKKGSGKSLLAEVLGSIAIKSNIPVFEIRSKLPGIFVRQLCEMCSPCIIYIDEVDRVYKGEYDRVELDELVSVIGASSATNVLTIITTNKKSALPDAFINRPTRFMFSIDYDFIPEEVVRDITVAAGFGEATVKYLLKVRHNLTYDVLNVYINLFKKYGSHTEYDKVKHLYNLPSEDTLCVSIEAVLDVKADTVINRRNYHTSGCTLSIEGKSEVMVNLSEFFSGDYPSGLVSYQTPNGEYKVLLKISDSNTNDDRQRSLDINFRPSIVDPVTFKESFDLDTWLNADVPTPNIMIAESQDNVSNVVKIKNSSLSGSHSPAPEVVTPPVKK